MTGLLPQIALMVALGVAALILHELAHGWTALALGDDTAKRAGRLSFNPLRHIDRVGTILLPGFLLAAQWLTIGRVIFMFGWAKPVPIDARRFRDPRRMMAVVAAAGPLMNFALAFLSVLMLRDSRLPSLVVSALDIFITFNLVLGIFNLLPIPPLDGGRIAVGVLPLPLARLWAGLERFGILIVLALLLLPAVLRQQGVDFDPVGRILLPAVNWTYSQMQHVAGVSYDIP